MVKKSLIIFALFLISCSQAQYQVQTLEIPKDTSLAVLPLKNLTSYPRAGHIVRELLVVELHQSQKFQLKDSPKLPSQDMDQTPPDAVTYGKAVDARYALTGSVTEFRYTKGLAEFPSVALQLQLIHIPSGKTVWHVSGSDVSKDTFFERSASLNELTQNICQKLVSYLILQE